jgi:hypothetical protein
MYPQNEPGEQRNAATDTVPASRSATEDDMTTGVLWSRDPVDDADGVPASDEARADEARADEARADEARADEARADEARADEAARGDGGVAAPDAPAVGVAQVPAVEPGSPDEAQQPEKARAEEADRAEADRAEADRAEADRAEEAAGTEAEEADRSEEAARVDEAVPATDAIWSDGDAQGFRTRWHEVQLRFVDDPRAAAQEAEELAGAAVEALTTAVTAHRDRLAGWHSASNGGTEELRLAILRYRDFLDRVLDL